MIINIYNISEFSRQQHQWDKPDRVLDDAVSEERLQQQRLLRAGPGLVHRLVSDLFGLGEGAVEVMCGGATVYVSG